MSMPTPPLRVLLMASSMHGGGSERQVAMLCNQLDRKRFAPHLYLTQAEGDYLSKIPADVPIHCFDRRERVDAVETKLSVLTKIYVPGKQLRQQTDYLEQVIREHQIDVVYDRTFHMTLLAGKACGRLPAKAVRRISTIVSPPHLALPSVEKRFVALKRRRLSHAYRSADQVVAVSKQAAQSAEAYYGLPADSVLVIKNPVDGSLLRQATTGTDPDPNFTTLIVVGRLTQEKGHADLLTALPAVREAWPDTRSPLRVRLVGDGILRRELEQQASGLGLDDMVIFDGHRPDPWNEIAAADALILPSRFEGMPNVMLEAMAIGTPVVATCSGGTIELQLEEPTAFWASTNDPQSLAKAILDFANRPEQARKQRDAATRLVDAEHDPQRYIRKVERLLSGG